MNIRIINKTHNGVSRKPISMPKYIFPFREEDAMGGAGVRRTFHLC